MRALSALFSVFCFCCIIKGANAQNYPTLITPSITSPLANPFETSPDQDNKNDISGFDFGTSVRLSALLSDNSPLLSKDVTWRVYTERADEQQGLSLVTQSNEAQPQLRLPPGQYVINAAFGRASVTRRLQVGNVPIQDRYILDAGGLVVSGQVEKASIADQKLTAKIYAGPGQGALVLDSVRGGEVVRLPAGNYHVVSTYGDSNASLGADIKVQAGIVTEATFNHKAAQVVLKLVKDNGGEAIANTTWSILTPGGDTVREIIGAFPSLVLQQGDYTAIARYDGRVFTTNFSVEPGKDLELEVLTQ